jgi:hypothetical protein
MGSNFVGVSERGAMKSEAEIQQEIQIEAAKHGIVLLRNNSGALKDKTGRVVRYGLGNYSKSQNKHFKSSDLIGIGPEGTFIAIEVKAENWKPSLTDEREAAQRNFIEWVKTHGGIAGFANSVDAFRSILGL